MVCSSSGSEPVGAVEKILLVDGTQYFDHPLLHEFVLEGGNRDRPLFPVFLGDVNSTQWLCPILAILERLMQFADVSRTVPFELLVGAAIHPATRLLSSL